MVSSVLPHYPLVAFYHHLDTNINEYVQLYICLNFIHVSGCVCKLWEHKEKIICVGVCVECAGIIKCGDDESSPARVFLGHLCRCDWRDLREGEEWPACLSLWDTEQNTTLMNQRGAGRRESDARALSAPQNHPPFGTVKEGRQTVSKVNALISSFWNSSTVMKLFLMVMSTGSSGQGKWLSGTPNVKLRSKHFQKVIQGTNYTVFYTNTLNAHTHVCDEKMCLNITRKLVHLLLICYLKEQFTQKGQINDYLLRKVWFSFVVHKTFQHGSNSPKQLR